MKFTQMWSSMVDAQLIASYDRTEVKAEGLENPPKDEVLLRLFSDTSLRTLTLVPSTLEVRVLLFARVVCHSHSSYAQDGIHEGATCGVQPGRSRCAWRKAACRRRMGDGAQEGLARPDLEKPHSYQ